MLSMTGYGAYAMEHDGCEIRMELKSVNHRYLDISFRIPRYMGYIEDDIRKVLSEKLVRGHVDVFISYRNNRDDNKQVKVDIPLVKAYMTAFESIRRETKLEDDLALSSFVTLPNVLTVSEAEDDQDEMKRLVMEVFEKTFAGLNQMRAREGKTLEADILSHLSVLETLLGDIKSRSPLVVEEYRAKLTSRISEMLRTGVDENRLATEVAFFADRWAIDEEISRLYSHIDQMKESTSGNQNGKKLDFIVQEMNREVNTIASKASDASIVHLAVAAKSEIEKIREQVQNIV